MILLEMIHLHYHKFRRCSKASFHYYFR